MPRFTIAVSDSTPVGVLSKIQTRDLQSPLSETFVEFGVPPLDSADVQIGPMSEKCQWNVQVSSGAPYQVVVALKNPSFPSVLSKKLARQCWVFLPQTIGIIVMPCKEAGSTLERELAAA